MSNWAGFSEEDLQKLQRNQSPKPRTYNSFNASQQINAGQKRNAGNQKPRHAVQPMKKLPESRDSSVVTENVPSAALLSPSKPQADPPPMKNDGVAVSEPTKTPHDESCVPESSTKAPAPDMKISLLLDDDDGRNRDLSTLQQYQQQQKMMEELNKKTKQMLADALDQRQKQATVESHKLNAIKKELSLLDQMVTTDVNVIRDRIEEATREYAEASKRYELAEKEFVASKINLHKKSDLKEQLTEHLYTIIHQNENRKAKKLAELMEKLDLATTQEEESTKLPDLPNYSLLGNLETVGSGNLVQHSPTTEGEQQPSPSCNSEQSQAIPSNDLTSNNTSTKVQAEPADATTSGSNQSSDNPPASEVIEEDLK